MAKTISQRIDDAFTGPETSALARAYSESVYKAWKDISSSLSRSALLLLLFIALFELLVYQRTSSSISIGSFVLSNVPIVQLALPAIVAFVFYDGLRLSVRWIDLQRAFASLMRIVAPKQEENGLDILIRPPLPSFWGIGANLEGQSSAVRDQFFFKANATVSTVIIFAVPIAFESQAYYDLVSKFGYTDVLLWISLSMTVIFLLLGLAYVVNRVLTEEPRRLA